MVQRMFALASSGFNVPKKGKLTLGGDDATPNAENNPFVATRVISTIPDKINNEKGGEVRWIIKVETYRAV